MKKIVLVMLMGLSSLFANGFGVDVGTKVSKINDKNSWYSKLKRISWRWWNRNFYEGFYKAG